MMFMHCRSCFEELPDGVSMRDYARLEVGVDGGELSVRCVRHDRDVYRGDLTDLGVERCDACECGHDNEEKN